jgi:hypothetical protein
MLDAEDTDAISDEERRTRGDHRIRRGRRASCEKKSDPPKFSRRIGSCCHRKKIKENASSGAVQHRTDDRPENANVARERIQIQAPFLPVFSFSHRSGGRKQKNSTNEKTSQWAGMAISREN